MSNVSNEGLIKALVVIFLKYQLRVITKLALQCNFPKLLGFSLNEVVSNVHFGHWKVAELSGRNQTSF